MKKNMFFITFILLSSITIKNYTQDDRFGNIITAISVSNISSNTLSIKWKSDRANGNFSIYFNQQKPIINKFILNNSELAITTNIIGMEFEDLYNYEYILILKKSGPYYFIVTVEDNSIDDTARGITDFKEIKTDYKIIPEINTTLQPIYINLTPKRYRQRTFQREYIPYKEYLITSLNLQITEDILRLNWSVYPKDLLKYIFVIYRSRYPITQFKSPEGLPEYARVTNQFFFEDRNIGFETPYYYAVVVEGSMQWNRGINIFTKPAVLIKDSPPLNFKPIIEYIKRKKILPNYRSEVLSEEDIQLAIQQTLSNLQILPIYVTNNIYSRSNMQEELILDQIFIPKSLTEEELTNLYLLSNQLHILSNNTKNDQQFNTEILEDKLIDNILLSNQLHISSLNIDLSKQENTPKLRQFEEKYFKIAETLVKSILENHNQSLKEQETLEENLINKDFLLYNDKLKKIKSEIVYYENIGNQLMNSDNLDHNRFIKLINELYKKRDHIRILQFHLRNQEITKVKTFENKIKEIYDAEDKQKKYLIDQYKKYYIKVKEKEFYQKQRYELEQIKRYKLLVQELKVARIASSISEKTKLLDPKNIQEKWKLGNIQPDFDQQLSKLMQEIKMIELQTPFIDQNPNNYKYQEKRFNPEKYMPKDEDIPLPSLDKSPSLQQRVDHLKDIYQKIYIEKVPDINDGPTENWIVRRETWLSENKILWNQKIEYWNKRTRNILGNKYTQLYNKWFYPSKQVALMEAKKSIQKEHYHEALYLLSYTIQDLNSLLLLGQIYYKLGYYKDAFSIFIVAVQMGIPNANTWLEMSSEKLLNRKLREEY